MRFLLSLFAVFFLAFFGGAETGARAGETGLAPVLPKAGGDSCVRDPEFMRSNHMEILLHRRDKSMHDGERAEGETAKESLKACLTCHAVPGADNKPVGFSDPKHFCRTCHDYAAVKIDCFDCHNSKPEKPLWSSWDRKKAKQMAKTDKSEEVAK